MRVTRVVDLRIALKNTENQRNHAEISLFKKQKECREIVGRPLNSQRKTAASTSSTRRPKSGWLGSTSSARAISRRSNRCCTTTSGCRPRRPSSESVCEESRPSSMWWSRSRRRTSFRLTAPTSASRARRCSRWRSRRRRCRGCRWRIGFGSNSEAFGRVSPSGSWHCWTATTIST